MKVINFLFALLLLSSCYSQKKAAQQMDKAHSNYELLTANRCASWYPIKIDTVYGEAVVKRTVDTILGETIFINCDSLTASSKTNTGTVFNLQRIPVKCPPSVYIHDSIEKPVYIVKENTAALRAATLERDSFKKSLATWQTSALILGCLLILSFIGIWYSLKNRK